MKLVGFVQSCPTFLPQFKGSKPTDSAAAEIGKLWIGQFLGALYSAAKCFLIKIALLPPKGETA